MAISKKKKKGLIWALILIPIIRFIIVVRARGSSWANVDDLTVVVKPNSGRLKSISYFGRVVLNDGAEGRLNLLGNQIEFMDPKATWVTV